MRKLSSLLQRALITAGVLSAALGVTGSHPAHAARIGILFNSQIPVYKAIADQFRSTVENNKHTVVILPYDRDDEEELLNNVRNAKVEYAFAIGAPSAKACNDAGVPGVFTMVVDPIKSGLTNKDGLSIGSLTGVLVNVSADAQFTKLKAVMGGRNRAGVVYDPSISAFVVAEYIRNSSKHGFEVFELPVSDPSEVPPAIESLKKNRIDFLLSVVDNTVFNTQTVQVILRFSIHEKIPLIGFSPQQVKAGAMIGFYCDYPTLGVQAGRLMENVISSGGDVSMIPVELPNEVKYAINTRTADIMRIDIPGPFLNGAEEKYD